MCCLQDRQVRQADLVGVVYHSCDGPVPGEGAAVGELALRVRLRQAAGVGVHLGQGECHLSEGLPLLWQQAVPLAKRGVLLDRPARGPEGAQAAGGGVFPLGEARLELEGADDGRLRDLEQQGTPGRLHHLVPVLAEVFEGACPGCVCPGDELIEGARHSEGVLFFFACGVAPGVGLGMALSGRCQV